MTTCGWTKGEWHLIVHRGHEHGDSIGTLESGFHHDGDPMYWTIASVNTRREGWECNARLIASAPQLYEALAELLSKAEREECHHESTHRGGTIWTLCNDCGQKWADDKGGFVPYVEPTHIAKARAALAAARGEG